MMKEHGILYTEENRLAVIEGRKWMTRRLPASFKVVNEKPDEWELYRYQPNMCKGSYEVWFHKIGDLQNPFTPFKIPYAVGDILYIKEPHYLYGWWSVANVNESTGTAKWCFHRDKDFGVWFPDNIPPFIAVRVQTRKDRVGWFKRSPLFMFKEDARHWQRVTSVKVERLQSISEADAIAEGIEHVACAIYRSPDTGNRTFNSAVAAYHGEWLSINGPGAWEFNPWLLAVAFERLAERREK